MKVAPNSIVFDCERMKYPHTGLYQFCLQMSRALIKTNNGQNLCFYTPPSAGKFVGDHHCYLSQSSLHKYFFPPVKNIAVWHCAHQSSDYFPFGKSCKKVLTIHDLNYLHDERKSSAKKKAFARDVQRKINEADHLVFISHYSYNDVKTHLNLQGKETSVIYNGCTINEIPSPPPPPYLPPKPFLFTLGTITDKKNFHVLPRLLPGNDFLLLIAGITQSESYKQKIVQEARKLGVQDRVVFTGPVWEADKQWYLRHCSAFVFPSIAEGFGLPVIESMYFERPVLLSKATSLPEIGGDLAAYFPSFEAADMQATLEQSLQPIDPARKEAMKARALSFSWDEAAVRYHQIYSELSEKTGGGKGNV